MLCIFQKKVIFHLAKTKLPSEISSLLALKIRDKDPKIRILAWKLICTSEIAKLFPTDIHSQLFEIGLLDVHTEVKSLAETACNIP